MASDQMIYKPPPFSPTAAIYPLRSRVQVLSNRPAAAHQPSPPSAFSTYREYLAASFTPPKRRPNFRFCPWMWNFSANFDLGTEQTIQEWNVEDFLKKDLKLSRLEQIESYLWFCADLAPALPLHEQLMKQRAIVATENVGLHLVRYSNRIFIKPMPAYLLHYEFWITYLCKDAEMYRCALGFVLSYIWLIRHESDMKIAQKFHLLSYEVKWSRWTKFVDSFLPTIHEALLHYSSKDIMNNRYEYGEINLTMLNVIHIYAKETGGFKMYATGYGQFSIFFQRNFAWMGLVFLFLVAILTAMQVGLAADHFKDKDSFNWVSGVFSIFCILLSAIVLAFPIVRHAFYFILIRYSGYQRTPLSQV